MDAGGDPRRWSLGDGEESVEVYVMTNGVDVGW